MMLLLLMMIVGVALGVVGTILVVIAAVGVATGCEAIC